MLLETDTNRRVVVDANGCEASGALAIDEPAGFVDDSEGSIAGDPVELDIGPLEEGQGHRLDGWNRDPADAAGEVVHERIITDRDVSPLRRLAVPGARCGPT